MNKIPKDFYNKFQYRKMRPFGERTGDWICKKCRNLNFAFRTECNRCKLQKGSEAKTIKNDKENDKISNQNLYQNNNIFNFYNNSNQNKKNNRYKNYHLYNNENKIIKNKDYSNNNEEK